MSPPDTAWYGVKGFGVAMGQLPNFDFFLYLGQVLSSLTNINLTRSQKLGNPHTFENERGWCSQLC